jgi:dolichyl-phosphate beta-glucosyltransferase
MDVSMHPTLDTTGPPEEPGTGTDEGSDGSPDELGQRAPRRSSRTRRALRALGFHVVAIALFAVPAVVLWWHVWSGHPSSTLTCGCGDPAQEVWFMEWPAWAIAHLHSLFFSGAVNVPDGANLLSNTSGTLIGVLLAPVTWLFGPITATNVALTLAPALSAWACFAALRPLITWKPGAIAAGLVYGYSAAIVTSLAFGHVSVTFLVIPPLLFTTLYEIVIRQEHSVRRDGLVLAALALTQFLISPEVLVMCLLFAVVGLLAVTVIGWRQVRVRSGHALPALALAVGVTAVLLAYPVWYGLAGPQAVTGMLFALAPVSGVPFSGVLSPGQYAAFAPEYVRFGGYLGRNGPPADYLGGGLAAVTVASVVVTRRRALTWLLLFLAAVTLWLALGGYLLSAPSWLGHPWLPWRALSGLPLFKEILPDQFAPFLTLFVAFLIAIGLDALYVVHRRPTSWMARHLRAVVASATALVAVVALVPVFVTFDLPFTVVPVRNPAFLRAVSSALPSGTVLLTIPFAVSGSAQPMLWQAVDDMQFRLAGAALKTPDALGGPVGQGAPGSARRILADLTVAGGAPPAGTPAEVTTVRRALGEWQVQEVVITGASRDPVYASGFFTLVFGTVPVYADRAWVWRVLRGPWSVPASGVSLAQCRAVAAAPGNRTDPLAMSKCVLSAAGGA